jgi:hypothetical protein
MNLSNLSAKKRKYKLLSFQANIPKCDNNNTYLIQYLERLILYLYLNYTLNTA